MAMFPHLSGDIQDHVAFFYTFTPNANWVQPPPERLDLLWFLGYEIDDEISNDSVLSKASATGCGGV